MQADEPVSAGPSDAPGDWLGVDYFDGRTSRAHPVRMRVAEGSLYIAGGGVARGIALSDVRWPPPMRARAGAGPRVAHLNDGGALHGDDAQAWDDWSARNGLRPSLVARAQSGWGSMLAACAVLLGLLAAIYLWGLPWLARGALAYTPASVDRAIGEAVLESTLSRMLGPTRVDAARQAQVREAFDRALRQAYAPEAPPPYDLRFHAGTDPALGPNALALPGGTIVLTDELVRLADGDDAMLVGVLAHEIGHVRHRHSMQLLARSAAIALAASVALGDVSGLVALAPVVLGQLSYSRDFEREADREALHVLRGAGLSPLAMVTFFERLGHQRAARAAEPAASDAPPRPRMTDLPGLSSHPADEERIRFFREAAGG